MRPQLPVQISDDLNPYNDFNRFIVFAEGVADVLPVDIRQKLSHFKQHSNQQGYLLIDHLPTDTELCPTPSSREEKLEKKTYISEFYLACIGSVLGDIFGFTAMNNGAMFSNVSPIKLAENDLPSRGAKTVLYLHTDLAFHSFLPDYLLLFCLRQYAEQDAYTSVSSLENAVTKLMSTQQAKCSSSIVGKLFTGEINFKLNIMGQIVGCKGFM